MENGNTNMANEKSKEDKNQKKNIIKLIVAAVVILGGLMYFMADSKAISESDLVTKTKSGVEFKVPEQWKKIDADTEGVVATYTDSGEETESDKTSQSLVVGVQDIGFSFDDLNSAERDQAKELFRSQFANAEFLDDDDCEKLGDVDYDETNQSGYDFAFTLAVECLERKDKDGKAYVTSMFGIDGNIMHMLAVSAVEGVWETNKDVFEVITESLKPE